MASAQRRLNVRCEWNGENVRKSVASLELERCLHVYFMRQNCSRCVQQIVAFNDGTGGKKASTWNRRNARVNRLHNIRVCGGKRNYKKCRRIACPVYSVGFAKPTIRFTCTVVPLCFTHTHTLIAMCGFFPQNSSLSLSHFSITLIHWPVRCKPLLN